MRSEEMIAFLMTEARASQHQLLLYLVKNGALTKEQAAAYCMDMAERIPHLAAADHPAQTLMPKFIEKWENIAAAMLGQDPLKRD